MRLTARGMGLAQYMFKRAEIVPFFPWGQGTETEGSDNLVPRVLSYLWGSDCWEMPDRRNDIQGFYDWSMSKNRSEQNV